MSKSIIISPEVKNWDKIYDFIYKYFRKNNLSQKSVFEILISSEEIFSNIIYHSCTETYDEVIISADYQILANTASVVFKYGGVEFNPLKNKLPDVSLPLYKRRLGGLGLLIVKNFTDGVTYTYSGGKNILKISKKVADI